MSKLRSDETFMRRAKRFLRTLGHEHTYFVFEATRRADGACYIVDRCDCGAQRPWRRSERTTWERLDELKNRCERNAAQAERGG